MTEPIDVQLKLYGMLVEQLAKYNAIFWQAPVLVGANVVAVWNLQNSGLLVALAIFNWAMIFAFWRMVTTQQAIIRATKRAEEAIRRIDGFVPAFPTHRFPFRGPRTLVVVMGLLNVWLSLCAGRNACA